MIVNIRGTSGSGKSTLMRQILDSFGLTTVDPPLLHVNRFGLPKRNKTWAYSNYRVSDPAISVIGDYSNDCGGCDGITTKGVAQDDIQSRVRIMHELGHVLFEGLLISHIYGRYRDMALEFQDQFVFAAMDTPLELCKERIAERRARMGRAPLADHKNTEMMYNDVLKVEQKCKADGLRFVWVDHTRAFQHVMELMEVDYAALGISP